MQSIGSVIGHQRSEASNLVFAGSTVSAGRGLAVVNATGTLTKNEMTVRQLWIPTTEIEVTGVGYEPTGAIGNRQMPSSGYPSNDGNRRLWTHRRFRHGGKRIISGQMRNVQEIAPLPVKLPIRPAYSQLITLQPLTTTQERLDSG